MGTIKRGSDRNRAVIYCRISEDPKGLERGVNRQQEDCQALAKARGWKVVETFIDNDISALRGQQRAGYQAMMSAVERGDSDWVIAYGLSRLWRNRRERADGMDTLAKARVSVALVKGSDLDLSSAAGRMYAGILGEFDTAESEIKAERVARAASQRAQEGRANAQCAYGWKRVHDRDEQGRVLSWRDVVDEPAADVVRGIVDDLLAGVTLRAITARLNADGIASPSGKTWITSSVRKLAVRDWNVGIRHHGDKTYKAAWEPIVDEEKHLRVIALLSDPSRRTQRAASRSHLLTFGIGKCGVCGGVLAVSRKGVPGKKMRLYVCRDHGCVGRREDWVDELLIRTVCHRLENADAAPVFQDEVDGRSLMDARRRLDSARGRLDDAAEAYGNAQIDLQQLTRITEKIRPELEAAEQAARHADPALPEFVEQLLTAPDKRAAWDGLSLTQQRKALEVFGLRVVIKPARGGPGFKEDSIDVVWPHD
jgi:DNA invertase Pin-like site-specific DNA recombinase